MKIAILSTLYPFRGGIAQFNAALFRALEENHEVQAFNFTTQYPNFLFPGKTQYVSEEDEAEKIPNSRVLSSINPLSYFKTVRKIKEFEPDVLIIGYWMPFMAPSLGFVAKKMAKSCRVISIIHNAIPHEQGKLDKLLSNYFFKRNTHCIALSDAVKKDIETAYPKISVRTLLHPVYEHFGETMHRTTAIVRLGMEPNKKFILFFGLIRDYKGLDQLLLAMNSLDSNVELIVAGEVYGSFEKYEQIIAEHNLKERVHLFLEYIPDNEVKIYFSAADAVVLPYKSGTQSGIIAIAKHFGKPIVATDVGGLSEFIAQNEGIIVPKDDISTLAVGIQKVLDLEYSSEDIQANLYTWKKFAEEVIQF